MSDQSRANVFYTDENVDGPAIGVARKIETSIQIVTAVEAGMLGAEDDEHFAFAVEHQYVLVTGNIKHFKPLFVEWLSLGKSHPGIVFITPHNQKNSIEIGRGLVKLMNETMDNRAEWI